MLLRVFEQLLTGDVGAFLEAEVVQASAAGFDPFIVAQSSLEHRHPREPWYRSQGWWSDDLNAAGLRASLILASTAETYCHYMRQWRLYWGERMPESVGCHGGWHIAGGWFGGSHTLAVQSPRSSSYLGWAIFTNEHGRLSFDDLPSDFADVIEQLEASNGWACDGDQAEPFGVLDFDDVLAFLTAFGAMEPAADLAQPFGVLDFDDVLAFLVSFGAGCP